MGEGGAPASLAGPLGEPSTQPSASSRRHENASSTRSRNGQSTARSPVTVPPNVRSWRRQDPKLQADWRYRRSSAVPRRRRWRAARDPRCGHALIAGSRGTVATSSSENDPQPRLPRRAPASAAAAEALGAVPSGLADVPIEAARHGTIPGRGRAPGRHAPG